MKSTPRLLLALLAASACNGGGDGTLSLQLTDEPPDLSNIKAVLVSINRAEAHVANGGGQDANVADDHGTWRAVLTRSRQFDLIKLQNGVTTTLGTLDMPPGKVTQIRLFVDESGDNEVVLTGGQICMLDLSNVDKTGIKINHPFKVIDIQEDKTTEVVVDFNLNESISKEGDCSYKLVPVIRIKSVHMTDSR